MAGVAMTVTAKFDELKRLKDEILNTKTAIKEMYAAGNGDGAKEQEKHLKSITKEHETLYKSMLPVIHEYKNLEKAGVETFQNISKASKTSELAEQLQIQKKVLADLESQYIKYKAEFDKVNVGGYGMTDPSRASSRETAKQLFVSSRNELNAEKKALADLEEQYKKIRAEEEKAASKEEQSANKQLTFLTQMRQIKQDMASLTNADGTVSAQNLQKYEELKTKLGEVGTAYRRVQQEQKLMTTAGSPALAGMIQGVSGVAGAFTAAQGVMSLFVKNNEDLAKIQTKLQAAMSITIGLQQVATTLNATSAFRIATVAKVTQLWSSANLRLATTFGISAAAANVLMGVLTLGLSVVITGIVMALNKLSTAQNKASEEQKKFASEVATSSHQMIADYEKLRQSYEKVGDSLDSKKKFITENKEEFKKLGVQINDVNDADNIFVNNTESFKEAIIARARATAAMSLAAEKFKEAIQKMVKAEKLPEYNTMKLGGQGGTYGGVQTMTTQKVLNQDRVKLEAEAKKDGEYAINYITKSLGWDSESQDKIKEAGVKSSDSIIENSKAWYQRIRDNAQNELELLPKSQKGSDVWKKLEKERDIASAALKSWDSQKTDNRAERDAEKQLQLQKKISEEVIEMMRKNQSDRIELMDEGEKKEIAKIENQYDKEIAAIEKKMAEWREAQKGTVTQEQTIAYDESYQTSFDKRIKAEGDFYRERDRKAKAAQDEYLKEFGRYEEKVLAINELYNQKIADAKTQGEKNTLEAQRSQELSKLSSDLMKNTSLWKKYFGDLEKLGKKSIKETIKQMETLIAYGKGDIKELPEGLKEVFSALNDGSEESEKSLDAISEGLENVYKQERKIKEINPFERIVKGFKDLSKAEADSEEHLKSMRNILSGFDEIGSVFTELGGAMEDAGMKAGEVVVTIGDVIGKAASMAGAGASIGGGWGAVIGAVVGAATAIIPALKKTHEVSEETRKYYESLIGVINELIDRELELMSVSSGEAASISAKRAKELTFYNEENERKYLEEYFSAHKKDNSLEGNVRRRIQKSLAESNEWISDEVNKFNNSKELQNKYKDKDAWNYIADLISEGKYSVDWGKYFNAKELEKAGIDITKLLSNFNEEILNLSAEQLEVLKFNAPEFWATITASEEINNRLNNIIESEQRRLQIEKSRLESATSISFDSLRDGLDDLVTDADLTFDKIGDSFEKHMSNAILNVVKKNILDEKLEAWYKNFADVMSDDSLTAQEAEDLRKEYEAAVKYANDRYKDAMTAAGIDMTEKGKEASENTLKGALAKASQESIDLLAGQTGAARKTLENIYNQMMNQTITLDPAIVSETMGSLMYISEIQASALTELVAIKELNAQIRESNAAIADNTNKINFLISTSNEIATGIGKSINDNADRMIEVVGAVESNTLSADRSISNIERNGIKVSV